MDDGTIKWYKMDGKYIMAGGTTSTEKELTSWVMAVAQEAGWLTYHVPDSRRVAAGFPDLVLLKPPELLFIELKKMGKGGTLKSLQETWLDGLQRCGQEATVWRASDIPQIWSRLTGMPFEP